jgi:hypothetical protein
MSGWFLVGAGLLMGGNIRPGQSCYNAFLFPVLRVNLKGLGRVGALGGWGAGPGLAAIMVL